VAGWRPCAGATLLMPSGVDGNHLFVVRESYVVYRNARIEQETHLITLVQQGLFRPHDPILGADFTNIKNGLAASPFTKREFKQLPI